MRAPTSYAGPRRKVKKPKHFSQTANTAMPESAGNVATLLKGKGSEIISVKGSDSVQFAVRVLREKRIGTVLVLDDDGRLEGILSERDVVRKLAEVTGDLDTLRVNELMTKNVKTCSPEAPISSVLHAMTEGRFRHLPVLDGDRVVGIVSIGDAVHFRVQEIEQETLLMKQVIVG